MKKHIVLFVLIALFLLTGAARAGLNEDLFGAVEKGNLEQIKKLLSAGAEVNAKTSKGETPLRLAEEKGHKSLVDLLRQHGGQ